MFDSILINCQVELFDFSDISFLCEATTAVLNQEQAKLVRPTRTTDKSAIRAAPIELKSEPVRDEFLCA